MELQLSSGSDPAECELAVGKLLKALIKEFSDIEVTQSVPGQKADCYRSVQISSGADLSFLEGSVKWNFGKFLIDRQGKVAGRYSPAYTPEKLESAIERLLG